MKGHKREEYINKLDSITKNISDYVYCVRPSYSFPFLRIDDIIHLPLPHLLIRSVTSSLLYRLTDNNKSLLDTIGKEVFENYLFDIITESNIFDEVFGEGIYYTENGSENRTLDIMTRIGNDYLFFDSKSTTPKIDIRTFDTSSIEKNTQVLADSCVQIYKHLTSKFQHYYNPFSKKGPVISKDNIWGVVVVREDSYITREKIYQRAAEKLDLSIDSDEYNWLCKHIGVTQLYEIERCCFVSENMIEKVKINATSGRINDYWFAGE